MFKKINDIVINLHTINKIEDIGIDSKDNKNYCRIFIIGGDESGIPVEGTLDQVLSILNS